MDNSKPITTEQNELFDQLLDKVHTEEQLRKQHYTTISTCLSDGSRRPAGGVIKCNEFTQSPGPKGNIARRQALALDCEMVGVGDGRKELAFLVVVDVLTGEILINNFVNHTNIVRNWQTKWSGITCADMKAAVRKNLALRGWRAARSMLFGFMDRNTILIGYTLQNDLNVLVIHSTVIDTAILTDDAVYGPLARPFQRTWSLKSLAKEYEFSP